MKILYFSNDLLDVVGNCRRKPDGQISYNVDNKWEDEYRKIEDRLDGLSLDDDILTEEEIADIAISVSNVGWMSDHSREDLFKSLTFLPDKEADYVYLYFFMRKTQSDIAEMFRVTQGDISYRLSKALMRLKFIMKRPDVERKFLEVFLKRFGLEKKDLSLMIEMWFDTSFAGVSRKMKLDQGKVRYRFHKNIDKVVNFITDNGDTYNDLEKLVLNTYMYLRDNSCILRELRSDKRWMKNVNRFYRVVGD